jgi:5'-nucleotidase
MGGLATVAARSGLVGAVMIAVVLGLASAATGTQSPERPRALRILVTNNDGVHSRGLDVFVEALRKEPNVTLTVVAPATDQTSTGDLTTRGSLSAWATRTLSGFPAIAVDGFAGDSVKHALDRVMPRKPHVVASGVNKGENLGPIVDSSGTVGAARVGRAHGVSSLAVSQGFAADPPYHLAAEMALEWLHDHRGELVAGKHRPRLESLNVPTCTSGAIRGLVRVPVAKSRFGLGEPSNCESTRVDPDDDVTAFLNGFATLSTIPSVRRPQA